MLKLEYGRPGDAECRLKKERRTYDFLDSLGIEYARVDHEITATMEECLAIDGTLGAPTCKNLFLSNRQQTAHYLLMIPADKPFKTKDLYKAAGLTSKQFDKVRTTHGINELLLSYKIGHGLYMKM